MSFSLNLTLILEATTILGHMTVETINEYLNDDSWLIKENANQIHSYAKLKGYIADTDMRKYSVMKYSPEITRAHSDAWIHIHDLSNGIVPYCSGSDLYELLTMGLWTPNIRSKPPKHLSSALDQITNFLIIKQNEWAGAQAFGNFNTLLAPYIRKYYDEMMEITGDGEKADGLTLRYVTQCIQQYIYNANQLFRGSNEIPFTNVIFNAKCPSSLADIPVHLKEYGTVSYAEFEEEALMFLRIFNKVMASGDADHKPLTFPIPTINLIKDMDWDHPVWREIAAVEAKYGYYYWMNFVGSGVEADSVQAMCCRLNIDLTNLPPAGGRWAFQGSTGSLGIVSLNMAKIGYVSRGQDVDTLLRTLDGVLDTARKALISKEQWILDSYEGGLMPLTKHYGVNFDRYFRTIGVIGLNEMCINYNDTTIENGGAELVKTVLEYIREWIKIVQMETGKLWNAEMSPGESAATRFALIDRRLHEGIFTQGDEDSPYYTTLLVPSNSDVGIVEKIGIEQEILPLFTGGTVHRIFMGENNPDPGALWKLIQRIATHSKIPYFDLAATFGVCTECQRTLSGNAGVCPTCGGVMDVYNRITGYYQPIRNANIGKRQEFKDRKYTSI